MTKKKTSRRPEKASPPGFLERFVALTGDGGESLRPTIQAFASILLLHLASRDGVRYFETGESWRLTLAVSFGLAFAASFTRALRPLAIYGALVLMTVKLVQVFPLNSNHFFVEYLSILFLALGYRGERSDRSTDEHLTALVRSLRWLPVLVLFWSGVKKVMHGTYFDGSFLAYSISHYRGMTQFFELLLPADEFARLSALRGAGPYRFEGLLPVVISNGIYLGEILVPILMLTRRWRTLGVWGACGVLVAIEAVAREFMFGSLFVNLLLLYTPGAWNRRLLPAFILFYAVFLGSAAGLLPEFYFN